MSHVTASPYRGTTWLFLLVFYARCDYFERERKRKEGNVLFNDALNTFYFYGYIASDIWLRTILIVRKEIHCRHIGYSYQLTARVHLYAPSHRQDSTYHGLCYSTENSHLVYNVHCMHYYIEKSLFSNIHCLP